MSRRASDKSRDRIITVALILVGATSMLASIIGYKAISALDLFSKLMSTAVRARASRLPEDF